MKKRHLFFIITVLTLSAYAFMVQPSFKTLDDNSSIVENKRIKDFRNLPEVFTSSFFGDTSYYRPMVSFSYMVEYHLFGLNARMFYITNILCHLLAVFIVFFLMLRMFHHLLSAFFISLLFAIHPIHWEAVSNISGRAILLSGMFSLLSFFAYVVHTQTRTRASFVSSVAFFGLGLLSKESSVTLPVLIFVYGYFMSTSRMRLLRVMLAYAAVFGVYVVWRKYLGIDTVFQWRTPLEALLGFMSFLRSAITHLQLFVLPEGLYFDRAQKVFSSLTEFQAIITVVTYAFLVGGCVFFRKKMDPLTKFFTAWFFIELIPVSQVFATIGVQPGYISAADHFLYTASIGVFVLAVSLGRIMYDRLSRKNKWFKISFIIFMTGVFASYYFKLMEQNMVSSSEYTMLKQSLAYNPHNTRIRESYALTLVGRGRFQEAEKELRRVLEVEPEKVRARISLGKVLCDMGRCAEGALEYEKIKDPGVHRELLEENKRLAYAIAVNQYLARLEKEPSNPQLHYSLGVMYSNTHNFDLAAKAYEQAVILDPDYANALFNLASSYALKGNMDKAEQCLMKLINLEVDKDEKFYHAYNHLAVIFDSKGEKQKAESYRHKAAALKEELRLP